MVASAVAVRLVRTSPKLGPAARELMSGLLSVAPAALALRGEGVAAYHGAEHISIGTYEPGERAPREHERCGSHLLGPLLATTAIGNTPASRAPDHMRTAARLGLTGRRVTVTLPAAAGTAFAVDRMTPFDPAGEGRTLSAPAVRIDGRAVAADGSWPGFRPATGVSADGVRLTLVTGEAAVVTL